MDDVTGPTTAAEELAAMRKASAAVESLDPEARRRVVDWLYDRYSDPLPGERFAAMLRAAGRRVDDDA